jgi:hypothetical protein
MESEHIKYYNEIRLPYDTLIKKAINYANPTSQSKTVTVSTPSPTIRLKHQRITVKPYTSAPIQLRLYFDRTLPQEQRGDVFVSSEGVVEHLVFQFLLA